MSRSGSALAALLVAAAAAEPLPQVWICDPRIGRLLATPDPFPPSR